MIHLITDPNENLIFEMTKEQIVYFIAAKHETGASR